MKEIVSHTNAYVKELKALKNKKFRDEFAKYIIEGHRVIDEAFLYNQQIEAVLVSDKTSKTAVMAQESGVKTIYVPHEIIHAISDTKSPPKEIACILKGQPNKSLKGNFFIALDRVSDPKNLGTIIRTADAAGVTGVIISNDSADYFSPKAQRAAMGSTFHIDICVGDLATELKAFKEEGGVVVVGDLTAKSELQAEFSKVCFVVGNEGAGITEEIAHLADVRYKLPIYGKAESLNVSVAAGIMLYDIKRRLKG